jgi:tetratricopeptide (TPR) repeat protein
VGSRASVIGLPILAAAVIVAAWFSFQAQTTDLPDRPPEEDPAPAERTDRKDPVAPRNARVPDPEEFTNKTIDVLIDEGDAQRALNAVEARIAKRPDDAELWRLKGKANYRLGMWRQAEKDYAKAIELDGEKVEYLDGRARALVRIRREKEAEKLLRRSIEISPDRSRPHAYLARIHLKSGRLAEAREEVRRALEIDPDDRMAQALEKLIEPTPK